MSASGTKRLPLDRRLCSRTVHRPRQYDQLASVPKAEFFDVLGRGLEAIASHVEMLVASAMRSDAAGDRLAAKILLAIGREEAGKFFILVDAARIPRKCQRRMTSQLKRAGDHLAKSLYFEAMDGRPATLSEIERYLHTERQSHYLDGPNDADWIFRNQAIAAREDTMYVDYQETDEGFIWHQPSLYLSDTSLHVSQVFRLVADMRAAGICHPAGLEIINEIWRDLVPTNGSDGLEDTPWTEIRDRNVRTLEQMRAEGVVVEIGVGAVRRIVDGWTFPMHSLDLTWIDVTNSIGDEQHRRMRAALWDLGGYADLVAEQWEDGPADMVRDMLGDLSCDEVDYQAEMRRAREEFIAEERLRFINEE